ncbi:MAG TPA: M14 family zinc carboxypeptidase [Actinomycetota bacterium]
MEVLGLRAPRAARGSIVFAAVVAITVVGALSASAAPTVDERELLGESYQGRPIRVFHRGDPDEIRVLVVGCIHGDECAGVRIAKRLRTGRPRSFLDLWILPSLNPDGRAARTRQNARGVDLNRNFPYDWRSGPRGRYYPGPRPASERETRIAMRLIRRIEPDITIWFHQPLALVDASGDVTVERRYARLVGLPLVHLGPLHGTATSWQNHILGRTDAFVVELPGGVVRPRRARRFASAVYRLVRA